MGAAKTAANAEITTHSGAAGATPAIMVEGLAKAYGATRAVDGLSFSVQLGEVFALLGPNAAGKPRRWRYWRATASRTPALC